MLHRAVAAFSHLLVSMFRQHTDSLDCRSDIGAQFLCDLHLTLTFQPQNVSAELSDKLGQPGSLYWSRL